MLISLGSAGDATRVLDNGLYRIVVNDAKFTAMNLQAGA
jgi:hypothetical protein